MARRVVKKILNLSGIEISRHRKATDGFRRLFKKYSSYTMVPEYAFVMNLELCQKYKDVPGDYVECGVWRGGMSGAISEVLQNKRVHLFDSFEGLPPAKDVDGKEALAWQQDKQSPHYYNNCAAEKEYAMQAMQLAGQHNYQIYEGWFENTTLHFAGKQISILRLDGDWYDSILTCLRNLFPFVSPGGIVILDDYYTWDGCAKAVHDYLSATKSPSRIHQWNNQVAYLAKKE